MEKNIFYWINFIERANACWGQGLIFKMYFRFLFVIRNLELEFCKIFPIISDALCLM